MWSNEIHVEALLLNQHMGRRNEYIIKRGMIELDALLISEEFEGLIDPQHLFQQFVPEL